MPKLEAKEPLPYWLINVPEHQRPATCPEFLLDISDRNKGMISLPEAEFHRLTWPEVQELIKNNEIDKFCRSPTDHRKYLAFMFELKKRYGSVMDFVRDERLKWTDLVPKALPFKDPGDLCILYNDWPYGLDPNIVHLVVWTKFVLEDDKDTGDLTKEMRAQIDEYVNKTFETRVPSKDLIWFKNWSSLKSIHSMEHFHVMLYEPDMDFIKEITNGDVAMSSRLPEDGSLPDI